MLCIINFKTCNMKKELVMILLSAMVIISVILWFTNTSHPINLREIGMYGAVILLVGFALLIAIKRIQAIKSGLKPEDELSKKIVQKAAAMSYYTSLYWFLILMYFSDKTKLESHTLIGLGIIGMAVLFAAFWVYYNYKGKFNE